MKDILRDFCLTKAPSGYEREMAYKLKRYLEPFCETSIDAMGNCVGFIKGSERQKKIMVFAHMDQLGFIVRRVEPDGYLQVDRLGGVPEKVLPGLKVSVRNESGEWYPGVIGVKSHHAEAVEDKYVVSPVTALFLDVGASDADEVRKLGIYAGCPAVYEPSFTELSGNKVTGTSVDNRGGCAVLAGLAAFFNKRRPLGDVYLAGTVWEEFNLRGAALASRNINPDAAISLDVTLSGDTRDLSARYDVALGKGACVQLYSFHGRGTLNGTLPNGPLFELVKNTAGELGLPLQRFASVGMLTDAAYMQLEGRGTACLEMGFPARYTHSPVEVCDTGDLNALVTLCGESALRIGGNFNFSRY